MPIITRISDISLKRTGGTAPESNSIFNEMVAAAKESAKKSTGSIDDILIIVQIIDEIKEKKPGELSLKYPSLSKAGSEAAINAAIKDIWKAIGITPPLNVDQIKRIKNYQEEIQHIERTTITDENLARTITEYREAPFPRDPNLSVSMKRHDNLYSVIHGEGRIRYQTVMSQLTDRYKRTEIDLIKQRLANDSRNELTLCDKINLLETYVQESQRKADRVLGFKSESQRTFFIDKEQIGLEVFGFSVSGVKKELSEAFNLALENELRTAKSKYAQEAVREHFLTKAVELGIFSEQLQKDIVNKTSKRSPIQIIRDLIPSTEKKTKADELKRKNVASFEKLAEGRPILSRNNAPKFEHNLGEGRSESFRAQIQREQGVLGRND